MVQIETKKELFPWWVKTETSPIKTSQKISIKCSSFTSGNITRGKHATLVQYIHTLNYHDTFLNHKFIETTSTFDR